LLAGAGAVAAVFLPFVVLKSNRIVPGDPRGLLDALPAWGALGCQAVLICAAIAALGVSNARVRLGAALLGVAAVALAVAAAGDALGRAGDAQRDPDDSGDRAVRHSDGAARGAGRRRAAGCGARDPWHRCRTGGGGPVSVFAAADRRQYGCGAEAGAAGRGRSRARHGHDELADPDGHRAHSGAAGHSHRHPHRTGAEHRHGDRSRPHRRRRTRDLRLSGDRADGHRPGAARGDSDRGTRLLRRRGTRCAGGGPGSGAAMISVENLSKQYGATTVVDGVSMVIERNSITVIVGTSGSGKSTLLRMINRLTEPTRGRVLIDGHDTTGEPAHLLRRRIGYAIQGHGLFPHRTVAENIATVPRLLGWDEARIRARVEELLLVFQLDPGAYAGAF